MRFLIRRTDRGGASLDEQYSGVRLTVGGGSAIVPLAGVAGALRFKAVGGGKAKWRSKQAGCLVEGRVRKRGSLSPGDVLELPPYAVTVMSPPAQFDLMLRIEASADVAASARYGQRLDLRATAWSVRKMAWLFGTLVLALGLLIPAASVLYPPAASFVREAPLPDDSLWATGPLHPAHAAVACQECHATPFVMVEDAACTECHALTADHAPLGADEAHAGLFAAHRCASCHREHNEPEHLVRQDETLCVDCHGDQALPPVAGEVHAFTAAGHPPFRLTLLRPPEDGDADWLPVRARQDGALEETSNLQFSHVQHLGDERIVLEAERLGLDWDCGACHQPADDAGFRPIDMELHCRSCHDLRLEPGLHLPHGDAHAARVFMEDHFFRVLATSAPDAGAPRRGRRRAAATACAAGDVQCWRREASRRAAAQFDISCQTCHGGGVQPVALATMWYVAARFDHASHSTQACSECHDASDSRRAEDILIPPRDACLTCHSQDHGPVPLVCLDCHRFHPLGATTLVSAGNAVSPLASPQPRSAGDGDPP